MHEELRQEKTIPNPKKEALLKLVPSLGQSAQKVFVGLKEELQNQILEDIAKQKDSEKHPEDILSRITLLLRKAIVVEAIGKDFSDVNHEPNLSAADLEDMRIDDAVSEEVGKRIRKAEKIRQRDNFDPKSKDRYTH